MHKSAVIYIRVSDPSQIDNNSLASQEKACNEFAKNKGYKVISVFKEEGRSAKNISGRPEFREMLSFVTNKANKVSAVIVYKLDRFSRNTADGLATMGILAKSKVEVLSVSEDVEQGPVGTALKTIMLAVGQLDNELKGVRVRDNMKAVFHKGLWPFKPPIGYKRKYRTKEENKGIPPILDPDLAPIIRSMFKDASEGIYNKTQLAKRMNLKGFGDHYVTQAGKTKANHKIVHNILTKTFHYGQMYASKWNEYSWGKHEPMIDKETWDKAYQKVILKKKNYVYRDVSIYPLKGSICCSECGKEMTTCPSRGRNRIVYYYECRNKDCRKTRIDSVVAHQLFMELLKEIKPNKRVVKLFTNNVFKHWDRIISSTREEAEKIEDRIASYKEELKSIRKSKDDGIYTVENAKEEADQIRKEITILEVERSDIKIEEYNAEIVREFIEHFLLNLDVLWEKLDLPKRQVFLKKLFPKGIGCTKDKKIRTIELSSSFQLIKAIEEGNGNYVSPPGIEPGSSA